MWSLWIFRLWKLVAPLIEECTETIEEVKLAKITLAENENSCKCNSCTVYTVSSSIFLQLMLELLFILFILIGT